MISNIYKLKLVVIGEHATGKTSLIKNFVEGQFSKDYRPTIGSNLFIKQLAFRKSLDSPSLDSAIPTSENNLPDPISTEYQVSLNLWDIAGQERWASIRHLYLRGAQGIIIVGDLSRRLTYELIESFWMKDLRENLDISNIPISLFANKTDLPPDISDQEVHAMAERINVKTVFFTSAKTGNHVMEAFQALIEKCMGIPHLIPISLKEFKN